MSKHGKKFEAASKQVEQRPYTLNDAVPLVQKVKFTKFDETVELHMRLGVDPKHADQMVRGTVVLPNGLGKSKKVLVIASGDKLREAEAAGADLFGGEEMVAKIQGESWTDFDAVIATPDMMRSVGRLGKVLGPRGLMPNPKTGTVTTDIATAVREVKAGKVEFRVDKTGVIHVPVRQGEFRNQQAARKRRQPDPGRHQGQARRGQRQVRQERDPLLHHGPGRPSGRHGLQREADLTEYTMKKKSDKEKDLEALKKDFEKAQNIFVTSFEKLTVQQDFELRKTVRGAGGDYKVVKNNLAEKASQGTPAEDLMSTSGGHDVHGLHQQGSGGAGQGADHLREGQSDVHFQGWNGGRPRDRRQVDSRAGRAATARRDFGEGSFPDSSIGAAVGHYARRRGAQPGGGGRSGGQGKQVFTISRIE